MPLPSPFPVFDAHVDSLQRELDLGHDLGTRTGGHLDLVRGREGGLGAVVLVSWCDPKFIAPEQGGAYSRTVRLLERFHRLIERHPDQISFVGNAHDFERARTAGHIAGIPGIEGGHSIEGSLDKLEWFFERGIRVMTLVWNNHLDWIRSCQDGAGADVPAGLSDFGRDVVRTMNRLGMVVDVSHAGVQSFHDVLETSSQPVIASHSGCYTLNDHPRNLSDDQLRELRDANGVVGMVFCTPFLDAEARAEESRLRATAEYRSIEGPTEADTFFAQGEFLMQHANPLHADRLLDHLCHAAEVAGVEHVGIGSDFDGIERRPVGLEDASCYGTIAVGMRARGFQEHEVRAVLSGNMERVFRQVTGPGTRAHDATLTPLHLETVR